MRLRCGLGPAATLASSVLRRSVAQGLPRFLAPPRFYSSPPAPPVEPPPAPPTVHGLGGAKAQAALTGPMAKSQVAQLSHTLGFTKPTYALVSSGPKGNRVSLTLTSGETFTSALHPTRKEAEYDVAAQALREAKCFQIVTVTPEELKQLPLVEFTGQVTVVDNMGMAHEVMKSFRSTLSHYPVIGFDTESQPHFYRSAARKAPPSSDLASSLPDLLQIASEEHAIIFRMRKLQRFPEPLAELLADASVMKLGAGVAQDAVLLRSFCPNLHSQSFIDLSRFARPFLAYPHGLQSLSGIFLRGMLSKRHQTSNWGLHRLTPGQLKYAATDAWVAVAIYRAMCKHDEVTACARIRAVLEHAGLVPHDRYIPRPR